MNNNLGRVLLLVGVVVLALLFGVLIGRKQTVRPTAAESTPQAVQITTAPPPTLAPPAPLPAPVQKPVAAAIPKIAPDLQVQEDAAAVGMTTAEPKDQDAGDGATIPVVAPPPARSAATPSGDQGADQPIG